MAIKALEYKQELTMNYKEKIKLATETADAILNEHVGEDKVREDLKSQGISGQDIDNVMVSTRKAIGERISPKLRAMLLEGTDPITSEEFSKLDSELLGRIIETESKDITREEKKKVSKLLKEGMSPEEITQHINTKFYPEALVHIQAQTFEAVNERNSGSSRMMYIIGGLLLIGLGIGLSVFSSKGGGGGRLYYGLVVFGLITMYKGFTTVQNPDIT